MNAFYKHHKDSIRFGYRCFDRILLNGLIQPFQQPERVIGFFDTYRHLYPVSRDVLRGAADQFQVWVKEQADKWNAPIVEAPKGRRDEFVEPYFRGAHPDQVVVILKAREPARIMTAIGDKKVNRWHLQIADRWIVQYNFYVNDQRWGRMFVRRCPYLPFSARVCLNQHHWLANRMREERIDFQQCSNAFLRCAAPERLQQLADALTAQDLSNCGRKWLIRFTPFFTQTERQQAGCQHRLFFSQVELCDNLIFHRRAALDKLGERLLDANRTIASCEASFADCNRREPGGILGAGEHLGWEIAMALKIDRIQPAGMNVRMQQGKPAYSHVVTVTGPAKIIYIAGQLGRDAEGNIVGPGDMRAQLEQTFKNLDACLRAGGATWADVVKTNTFVTDYQAFSQCSDVRMRYFGVGSPTSTTIQISGLAQPEAMVEIEMIAAVE
jgi:enamine deaminase RidA (YjgF/YER057c/UK114 family)